MAESLRLGVNAKLYYASIDTWDAETWAIVATVNDLKETPGWNTAEAQDRASGIAALAKLNPTLRITGTIRVDENQASYLAMRAAYKSRNPINLMNLSGPKDSNGAEGFKGYFHVINWGGDQGMQAAGYREFELAPAIVGTATPFKSVVVAGGVPVYTNFLPPT